MANILIVEDSDELAKSLASLLNNKHKAVYANDLMTAKKLLSENHFDLLTLDVTLPDGSSFDLFKTSYREQLLKMPIIFLTGQNDIEHRMKGLELGAQDYILKPFSGRELLQRIDMRLQQFQAQTSILNFGDLRFEKDLYKVSIMLAASSENLNLTPNEYKILYYLAAHHGQVISRQQIVDHAWGAGYSLTDKAVNTHISNIRKKIQASATSKITAVEGKGYCFTIEVKQN